MEGKRNIEKIFQKIVFTLIAFFIFGVTNVNAEEIIKTVTELDELKSNIKDGADTDVIKLGADISTSEELTWYINGNKTLDLAGYSLTGTSEIMFKLRYDGNYKLTVIDSSNSETSAIVHDYNGSYGTIFQLSSTNAERNSNKTLYIDGVHINEIGNRAARTIYNYKANGSVDTLIVKNSNIETIDFALWFTNYEFSNITLKPSSILKQTRLINEGDTTTLVGSVLGENQEVYYDMKTTDGTSYEKVIADTSEKMKDIYVENFNENDDHSLVIRLKQGLNVTHVDLNEIYGYVDGTPKEISIKNNGASNLQIESVTVDDATKFTIIPGSKVTLGDQQTDTSWKIKANPGLNKGDYTATITVTDSNGNTYRADVILKVEPKNLADLGIGNINDTIVYGDSYEPVILGVNELSLNDYKVTYFKENNDVFEEISEKPINHGKYKITVEITNDNYVLSSASVNFTIIQKDISSTLTIEGLLDSYMYTGSKITVSHIIKDGDVTLDENKDFTFEFSDETDCINVGPCTMIYKSVSDSNYYFTTQEVSRNIFDELTSDNVVLTKTTYKLIDDGVKPEPIVKNNAGLTLEKGIDYELSYTNNTSIGIAYINITGKGYYVTTKPIKVEFTIVEKETQEINFTTTSVTKTYGDAHFTLTANHPVGDGTISYKSSNENVATVDEKSGKVTIKSVGTAIISATASVTSAYAESSTEYSLVVNKKDISYTAQIENKIYDNTTSAKISKVIFNGLVNGEQLTQDTDYIISASFASSKVNSNVDVNVKLELLDTNLANNYNLINEENVVQASIMGKSISNLNITLDEDAFTYTGSIIIPDVTVVDGSYTLEKDTDYTLEYINNENVGIASVIIKGIGNYTDEVTKNYTINKKTITLEVDNIDDVTYNNKQHKPDVTIRIKDTTTELIKGVDYNLSYGENINAGNGTVIIDYIDSSNYLFGQTTASFNINKYILTEEDVELEYSKVIYDGTDKEPSVTIKFEDEIIPTSDYTITYTDNKEVGMASVTINIDTTNITGEVTKYFEIANKTSLEISGIEDQQVTYTGNPVELIGTLQVSHGINPNNINIKWYKDDVEIDRPTKVGIYKVVFSYEDENYIGTKTINVVITKKTSIVPDITLEKGIVNDELSTITLPDGFKWGNENDVLVPGNREYDATYTQNNDSENYTTENIRLNVYGKSKANLDTRVNGIGGTISESKFDLLEGTVETVILTPSAGYEIDKLEVNGVDKTDQIVDNKIDITIETEDLDVVVTYKIIQYTITIDDVENATINPSGVIKVDYNSDKTITISANNGYNLVSVKVNGVEKISELLNNELTLSNILEDTTIVVVVERNVYEVIEGANQKYVVSKNNEAKFKFDVEYSKFEDGGKVYVDDKLIDPSNYTSESGSTIITLKKEFVDTLSEGTHTLKVLFNDGEGSTTFTVEKIINVTPSEDAPVIENNPKTNDDIMTYVLTGVISTIGLTSTIFLLKRKKHN